MLLFSGEEKHKLDEPFSFGMPCSSCPFLVLVKSELICQDAMGTLSIIIVIYSYQTYYSKRHTSTLCPAYFFIMRKNGISLDIDRATNVL